jgi:CRISPR/Cas system CSM-associated protein Csm2 small subunit
MANTIINAKHNGLKKPIYDLNLRHLADPILVPQEKKLTTEAEKLQVVLAFARLRDMIEEELDNVVVVSTLEGQNETTV